MKKNNKNRQVIMALTMAINASMLLNPVLAKAEGLEVNPDAKDNNSVPVTPLNPTNEDATAVATATENALEAAKDAKENIVETVSETEGYNKVVSGVVPAADAAKEVDDIFDADADKAVDGINDTIENLEDAAFAEVKGNAAKKIADGEAEKANTAASEADKFAAEYAKQVDALSEKIVGVAETIDENNKAIEKASTVQEAEGYAKAAKDAFDSLKTIEEDISAAETNYNTELGKYNNAKDKYDTAAEAYGTVKEEYAGLIDGAATGAAVTADTLGDMRQGLSELKHQVEMNQNLLIIKETEDKILAQLEQKSTVEFFDQKADKKKEFKTTVNVDGKNATVYVQKLDKEYISNTGNMTTYADYFNKIVALYYTDAVLDGEFSDLEWNRFEKIDGFTYTDENDNKITGATAADTLNYCVVNYHEYVKDEKGNYVLDENGNRTVSDNVSTVYLNYKTSNNNNKSVNKNNPYQGIVIFEKTDHLVMDSKDLKSAEIEELNEEGYIVDTDATGEATRILVKDEKGIGKLDLTKSEETKLYDENKLVLSDETDEDGVRTLKTVDEDSEENVSYAFADGKVTKSVEKGVTVTTYTNETLAALDKSLYSVTEDEAKEAFAKALTDKLDLLNEGESLIIRVGEEDVTVTKGTVITKENAASYGYVKAEDNEAAGVYNVKGTFTKSVVVSKECESVREGEEFVANYNYKDKLFSHQQDHKLASDNAVTINGNTVTVEYEDLKSVKVSDGIFDAIEDILGSDKTSEEITAILRSKGINIPEGSVVFTYDAINGSLGTATIYYVEGHTCETIVTLDNAEATKEEIKEAVKNALSLENGANININNLNVAYEQGTTYGYQQLAYILKTVNENSERAVVSTEVFETVEKYATLERRNDNWYAGNIALATQKSADDKYRDVKADTKNPTGKIVDIFLDEDEEKITDDFRKAIDGAAAEAANYAGLIEKIEKADKLIAEAKAEVDALSDEIKDLTGLKDIDSKVNALTKNLDDAKAKLNEALNKKNELVKALEETEKKLADKISELNTPPYYPNTNNDTNKEEDNKKEEDSKEETKEETGEETLTVSEDETAQGSANVADDKDKKEDKKTKKDKASKDKASTMDLGVGEGQALGSAVVNDTKDTDATASEIDVEEDKETALGEAKETENDEEAKDETPAEEKETEKETGSKVDITEDETPEGAADSVDTVKPNFWWLLLILILGATGEEMYRRHRNKKKAAKEKVKNV